MAPASSKEFLDIQATVECGFTLKLVRDMLKTYNQMYRTDKYSQHSSIIWPVWLNGWVFVYELSGCGFESRCSHLIFRYGACFEQGVSWHSGNCRVWIHSQTRTWHDKNIQPYVLLLSTFIWRVRNPLRSLHITALSENQTCFYVASWKIFTLECNL